MNLAGRRIVLGVTGGIAAYKAIEVCRRLVDAGAHVIPVMTAGASRFVGATTLSALASEPVKTRLWDDPETPIPHTKLGQSADLVLVAPATARIIAAYRAGLSTDLLTNVLLATRAPVMICPAMHTEMWEHPATVANVATLRARGIHVLEPDSGRLTGTDSGPGRLRQPARPGVGTGQATDRGRQHDRSAAAEGGHVVLGGRVQPHLGVHRRGHDDRAARGQQRAGQQVVGEAGRRPGEQVGCGGGDDHQVGLLADPHVRDLVDVVPDLGRDRVPGQGRPGRGSDELQRSTGRHDADVVAALGEPPEQVGHLVGRDPAPDAEHHSRAVGGHGGVRRPTGRQAWSIFS